jgi:hypothetical protein
MTRHPASRLLTLFGGSMELYTLYHRFFNLSSLQFDYNRSVVGGNGV